MAGRANGKPSDSCSGEPGSTPGPAPQSFADRGLKPGPVPADVLAYWRSKKLTPGFDYRDVWNEEHDYAFSAAKIMRLDVLAAMRAELDRAIRGGVPFDQWRKDVEPRFQTLGWWEPQEVTDPKSGEVVTIKPPERLRTIFLTNMRTARAVGQYDRIQRAKRSRPFLLYQVGPSVRHREEHLAWHGLLLPVDDPFWSFAFPPNGWGCFLPGTRISGEIIGASKAWYEGQAVEIELRGGDRLSVTPNHPIATARGWLRADDLREGDDAIRHELESELVRFAGRPNTSRGAVGNEHMPPRVENVFDALASHGARSADVSALDFHGEAQRFIGKVDVVGSYVDLVQNIDPALSKSGGQAALSWPHGALIHEHGSGHFDSLESTMLASGRSPGFSAERHRVGATHPPPALLRRFGHASHVHATSLKKTDEGGAGHAAFLRELLNRNAGAIALDQIVGVRRFPYSGHVFDLETRSGWLLANGIAASNCKCWVRAVSPREADRLESEGILGPNPDPVRDDNGNPTGHVLDQRVAVRRTAPDVPLVPWENKRTGQTEFVPLGIDPGFHHTPGEGRRLALQAAE